MTSSDLTLLALHGLRLKGFAETPAVADLLGVPVALLGLQLSSLSDQGFVMRRDGSRCGWALTAAGRAEHERLLAEELDGSGQRRAVQDCYQAFGPLNRRLLALCTKWQIREIDGAQVVNDHSDPAHDSTVLAELVAIDTEIQPITHELTEFLDRFAIHGPRLTKALAGVLEGDYDWLANPLIDSYHTVWFELHEDLLATLGLDRATESLADTPTSTN